MWFPLDTETAQLQNGLWVCTFGGYNTARLLQSISLVGPANSSVTVYLDTIFIDTTARGDFNRADYFEGIPVAQGRQLILRWNVGTGTAPMATAAFTDGIAAMSSVANTGQIFTNAS